MVETMANIFISLLVIIELLVVNHFIPVKITAYSARACETDSTPNITASNKHVKVGYVALSRDLESDYNLRFGDKIHVYDIGTFEFQDRMHRRKKRQIDIFMHSTRKALKFGVQKGFIIINKKERRL
jgi:3D (Asp-Asp-Asp) domain-containing protein